MRRYWILLIALVLPLALTADDKAGSPAQATPSKLAPVRVYPVGGEVGIPKLLVQGRFNIPRGKCKDEHQETVRLAIVVDANGSAQRYLVESVGLAFEEREALQVVAEDQFKPAMRQGEPVAAAILDDVEIVTCTDNIKDAAGATNEGRRLKTQPIQRFLAAEKPVIDLLAQQGKAVPADVSSASPAHAHGPGGVTPPLPLRSPEAHYTPAARNARIQGTCIVSLIVDANGMVKDPVITKSLGYGLDEAALDAVGQYRFKPAMRNGVPVPVRIAIEVNFRPY